MPRQIWFFLQDRSENQIQVGDYVYITFDGMLIHNHAPYAPLCKQEIVS